MTSIDALPALETVTLERDEHVLLIGLNRPHKRNAFNQAMLADLARAYGLAGVRCIGARGCAVRPRRSLHRRSGPCRRRPQHRFRRLTRPSRRTGPLAPGRFLDDAAGRGRARLVHDAGYRAAAGRRQSASRRRAPGSRSSRCSVGSTRSGAPRCDFPREAGWGQCHALAAPPATSSTPPRHTAFGVVQEVVDDAAAALTRAREIAHTIAGRAAPLAVRATLASAHLAREQGDAGRHRAATTRRGRPVRQRGRRRGCAVVHRAPPSPIPRALTGLRSAQAIERRQAWATTRATCATWSSTSLKR